MIVCGWCHKETEPGLCAVCGRDAALPWVQRGMEPPSVIPGARNRKRLDDAAAELRADGFQATAERLADRLDVSVRTVRRWQSDGRPTT